MLMICDRNSRGTSKCIGIVKDYCIYYSVHEDLEESMYNCTDTDLNRHSVIDGIVDVSLCTIDGLVISDHHEAVAKAVVVMKYLNKAVLMKMQLAIALYVIMYAMHVRCAFLSIYSLYTNGSVLYACIYI